MIRRAFLTVFALVTSAGARSMASVSSTAPVTIAVDGAAPGAPLDPVWSYYGYDEANYTTTPEGEELLRVLAAAHSSRVRVRTHFLFNTGNGAAALKWGSTNVYTEDAAQNPIYDYTLIDQIMDATVLAGALPLVEIGFMPKALSKRPNPYENSSTYVLDGGCFYPPRDYAKWAELVSAWAAHVKDRYSDTAASWEWELWNEPDIGYWRGSFEDFARLYDHTEAALHGVFPEASLGGPAVARADGPFLSQFLEHCATGTNAVTGQTGTRLDMVNFHAKGGVTVVDGHVRMDLGNQLRLHRSGFDAVAGSAFASTPIVISEADPDGCAACPATMVPANAYRNSPAYGAYALAMMKRSIELASEVGVSLRGVLTWAFTFPGTPYFAGYRALATNGIHLPVLNAFKLLGGLRGARLPVTSSGALPLSDILDGSVRQQPDIDALAVRDGELIQVLIWHYHDDLVEAPPARVTLNVSLPPAFGTSARVTHTRVDDTHGNAYAVWLSHGSPSAPSPAELAALREAMEPGLLPSDNVQVVGTAVSLSFDLPRFGVSLVTLAPSNASERGASLGGGAGGACGLASPGRSNIGALLPLAVALGLQRRRSSRRPVAGQLI